MNVANPENHGNRCHWKFGFALAVIFSVPCYGQTNTQTAAPTSAWVHGSYVNLRQAARNDATVVEQLPQNTPLKLMQRKADWCEVETLSATPNTSKRGFMLCRFVGDKPLTLNDLKNATPSEAARRGFWIAPSWSRFVALGENLTNTLLSDKQKEAEFKAQRTNRWVVPEWEAAKARLRAGFQPQIADEINGIPIKVQSSAWDNLPKGALPPISPSLFRKRTEFVLSPSIDQAAALYGSTLQTLRIVRAPAFQNDRFEVQWFDGVWDIAEVELSANPPFTVYGLAANGMLSAKSIDRVIANAKPTEVGCGSVNTQNYYAGWQTASEKNLPNYPRIKSEQEILQLFTIHPLKPESVQVTVREFRVNLVDGGGQRSTGKIIIQLIDLNKDKIPDVAIIHGQVAGQISPFLATKTILFNIGGAWSQELDTTEDDCT